MKQGEAGGSGSEGSGLIARRWVVQGRVQGIGFRWFIMSRAQSMGVRGWARNRADGAVEVVALATAPTLEAFEAQVRRGPPGALVTSLTTEEVPHDDVDAKSFVIK